MPFCRPECKNLIYFCTFLHSFYLGANNYIIKLFWRLTVLARTACPNLRTHCFHIQLYIFHCFIPPTLLYVCVCVCVCINNVHIVLTHGDCPKLSYLLISCIKSVALFNRLCFKPLWNNLVENLEELKVKNVLLRVFILSNFISNIPTLVGWLEIVHLFGVAFDWSYIWLILLHLVLKITFSPIRLHTHSYQMKTYKTKNSKQI